MAVSSPVGIPRETLDLVEYANQLRGPRGRAITAGDFLPIGGGMPVAPAAIGQNNLFFTIFQWTVPKGSLGLLCTWITAYGADASITTLLPTEAIDQSGLSQVKINKNGQLFRGPIPFTAVLNQPIQLTFKNNTVFSILLSRDPLNTTVAQPAHSTQVMCAVRGYMVDESILGLFPESGLINGAASTNPAGTGGGGSGVIIPSSGVIY